MHGEPRKRIKGGWGRRRKVLRRERRGIQRPHVAGDRGASSPQGEEWAGRKWDEAGKRWGQSFPRGERKGLCVQEGASGCMWGGYGGSLTYVGG